MPPDVHPAIAQRIDELLGKAEDLVVSQQQNLDILAKTIALKDTYGIKMRVADVLSFADKLQWIAAQLDALRSIPYDMAAADVGAKRRTSSAQMSAVKRPPGE